MGWRRGLRFERALRLLVSQPGLFLRKLAAALTPRWLLPRKPVCRRFRGVRFAVDLDLDPRMKQVCFATYEPETVALMRRLLRPGDTIIDVGASIGYLTAVAASLVGPEGQVHAFEPVQRYRRRLEALASSNANYTILVVGCALGEKEGRAPIAITSGANIGWNTMVPGFMPAEDVAEEVDVPVRRLDDYLEEKGLCDIRMIKIDVEGYELPVLRGLARFLDKRIRLPVILCEVAPDAYPRLQATVGDLVDYMRGFSYQAYDVTEPRRPLDLTTLTVTTNVLFLPRRRPEPGRKGSPRAPRLQPGGAREGVDRLDRTALTG